MKWIYLLIAGILEITWAVAMKMSDGFTVLLPSIITVVGYIASAVFLAIALKHLPLGTAYAMRTGMGIAEKWNITGRQVQKCVPKGKYREHRSSEMHGRFRKTLKSQLMEESLLVSGRDL